MSALSSTLKYEYWLILIESTQLNSKTKLSAFVLFERGRVSWKV